MNLTTKQIKQIVGIIGLAILPCVAILLICGTVSAQPVMTVDKTTVYSDEEFTIDLMNVTDIPGTMIQIGNVGFGPASTLMVKIAPGTYRYSKGFSIKQFLYLKDYTGPVDIRLLADGGGTVVDTRTVTIIPKPTPTPTPTPEPTVTPTVEPTEDYGSTIEALEQQVTVHETEISDIKSTLARTTEPTPVPASVTTPEVTVEVTPEPVPTVTETPTVTVTTDYEARIAALEKEIADYEAKQQEQDSWIDMILKFLGLKK